MKKMKKKKRGREVLLPHELGESLDTGIATHSPRKEQRKRETEEKRKR